MVRLQFINLSDARPHSICQPTIDRLLSFWFLLEWRAAFDEPTENRSDNGTRLDQLFREEAWLWSFEWWVFL